MFNITRRHRKTYFQELDNGFCQTQYLRNGRRRVRPPFCGYTEFLGPVRASWCKPFVHQIEGIPSNVNIPSSIVIEDALKSFRAGYNPQPVFFYCSRNTAEATRSDPKAILASLARQLSCPKLGEPLLNPTVKLYRKKEAEGFASGSLKMEESYALIVQLSSIRLQR